ncbi:STAS domain-containing protein [Streptomyces bungoensis]
MSALPSIVRSLSGGCLVGRVIGEMDYLTNPACLTLFGDLAAAPNACLVLDLSGVTFCDSSGLNALLEAGRIAADKGKSLALARVPPALRRMLMWTGMDQVLVIHETVVEATTALGGTPGGHVPPPS